MNTLIKKSILIIGTSILMISTFFIWNEPSYAACVTQEDCKEKLEQIDQEIKKIEFDIKSEYDRQRTLSGEINKLSGEINQTASKIQEKNSLISNIRNDIIRKERSLEALNERLEREKKSLESVLRKRFELEDATILEVILSSKDVSEFYEDAPRYSSIQQSLSDSFAIIDELKVDIYHQKTTLENKREEENNVKYSLELEKNKIEVQKKDRDQAYSVSESKEASFEQLKEEREKEAREIRARLIQFQGAGIGSRSISFGEAYDYAKFASGKTGVRTAFIMAIMQQETGFGRNVGGCNLRNSETGDGVYISTGNPSVRNMVPGNFENFKKITASLGRDWSNTPISCVAYSNGKPYGYGGAMGYTQFIPNTWMSVEARVRNYFGASVANPWDPQHAVMATAVFVRDLGAASQTYSAEYNAACRYYGSCSVYAYGTNVMNKAVSIQTQIDLLERR